MLDTFEQNAVGFLSCYRLKVIGFHSSSQYQEGITKKCTFIEFDDNSLQ